MKKTLASLLFAVIVAVFWAVGETHILGYQEQYQMFLFTPDYFWQRFHTPGGLVDWIAEFITQFNYLYVVGAILLGILFFVFQRLTALLCSRHGLPDRWYALTFVPAILLLAYMGNADVMPSFLIALILLELMMLGWDNLLDFNTGTKIIILIFSLQIAYWFFGPVTLSFGLYIIVTTLTRKEETTKSKAFIVAGVIIFISIAIRDAVRETPYPLYRLFGGLNYFRYPTAIPKMQIVLMVLVPLWPFISNLLNYYAANKPASRPSHAKPIVLATWTIIVLGGAAWVYTCFNTKANEMISYDYLVRTHNWDKILQKATKTDDPAPMEVACTNLALSEKGQLCDRLFDFYQNGTQGLFPVFTRDMLSPVSTAEIFYSLGMVNDAERYMFEAQQAIPNFRRSARLSRHIIECEIINGHYAVARKLLHELKHTLFYRAWAKQQLTTLDSLQREAIINADPVYGKLRRYRVTKDYLFSDTEMDQMLGLLFAHCHENKNAYEYLMAYELVNRDMPRFMQYYPIGRYAGYTDHIPYAIQQGLLYDWTQRHGSFQGLPYSIDPQWRQAMAQFIETYMRDKHNPSLTTEPLGNTFWSYMLVKNWK